MEDTEVITAPLEEGVVSQNDTSKESLPEVKSPAESQVPASDKVDVTKSTPQVTTTPRARPSEFYGMRKDMRFLKEAIAKRDQENAEMAAYIKSLKSPDAVAPSKFDKDKFFTDPDAILSAREKAMRDEIESLRKEFGTYKERNTVSERAKSEQDALETLFPKSSPESADTLEERMEANAERVDKLMKLLKSKPALDMLFKLDPKEAVNIISEKLDGIPAKNPTVLPKKLMGGAKGGGGAASNLSTKDQKRAELKRMSNEMAQNEELRFDEKHKEKRDQLIRELERLEKE